MLLLSVFKAASLDGHMAFLVAVHYVIFYWKFCMQVWSFLLLLLAPQITGMHDLMFL